MSNWLETTFGASTAPAIMWIVLAILVLIVLLVVLRVIRTMRSGTFIHGGRNRAPRLAVVDATAVDAQRRLVLVRRDNIEHLILIGGPTDVVIEPGIRTDDHERALSERQLRAEPAQMQPSHVKAEPPQAASMKAAPRPAPAAPAPTKPPSEPRRHTVAVTPPDMNNAPESPQPEPAMRAQPQPRPERPREPFAAAAPQPERRAADALDIVPSRTPAPQAPEPLEVSLEEEMGRLLEDISVEETRRRH